MHLVVEPDDLLLLRRPLRAARRADGCSSGRIRLSVPADPAGCGDAVVQAERGVLPTELARLAPAPDLVVVGDQDAVRAVNGAYGGVEFLRIRCTGLLPVLVAAHEVEAPTARVALPIASWPRPGARRAPHTGVLRREYRQNYGLASIRIDASKGPQMVTSRDVARVAGVSQSTVSYVMSGRRSISAETRRRVEAAIEQLTYQPNAGARALASQRTQVIGLIVPFARGVEPTGLLPFIETIAGCARAADHDVLLVTADEGTAGLTRLAGRSLCDAIVMMDIEADDIRIPVAASLDIPVILIGVPNDSAGLHCVDVDFPLAGRLAVEELAGTGHDRIVLMGRSADTVERDLNYVRRFQRGADAAAAQARGVAYTVLPPMAPGRAGAEEAVGQALAGGGERVGLVVPNSQAVPAVLQAAVDRGLVPGRDLGLVGLCTDVAAEATRPAVTNVSLEPRDVSRRAMQTLFRLLDRDDERLPADVELVAPHLTRRETTAPPS